MSFVKEVVYHYSCDANGCSSKGKGGEIPLGWTRVNILGGKTNPGEAAEHALLCDQCSARIKAIVSFKAKKKEAEKGTET